MAQLIGLLVLGAIFSPPVREFLLGLGVILLGVLLLAGIVAIGVILIRRSERKSSLHIIDFPNSPDPQPPPATERKRKPTEYVVTTSPPPTPHHYQPPADVDLLQQIHTIDWFQFEKLVALVYRKLGYSVARRGGANPDGGIDLVIEKNDQRWAVQCKQWKTWNVGVKSVREFLGALTDAGIPKGIFITLRGYTAEAKQLAEKHGIAIVNETELVRMLESTDAKFDPEVHSILSDPRKFCPKCDCEMVLRIRLKLGNGGNSFINDCVPALLNRRIFVEVENRGSGQQRHFKLGRPMALLNESLEACEGEFSRFLDLGGIQPQ